VTRAGFCLVEADGACDHIESRAFSTREAMQ
jgi:hypothetical protein